ncbi:MAG: cyclic-di-AMP receptor [Peptoniphilaceae bacterium]
MKMIIAIIQDKFIDKLMDRFLDEEIYVTKVSTSGGFFKSGNTTLLVGADESELDHIDSIFREVTQTEEVKTEMGSFEISGATIFVIDVEKSLRI